MNDTLEIDEVKRGMLRRLRFHPLVKRLGELLAAQPDGRKGNAVQYSIRDAGLAAFAVFFMQSPSFLAYQRDMAKRKGSSNARTLFELERIPCDQQIRNILDEIHPWRAKDSSPRGVRAIP